MKRIAIVVTTAALLAPISSALAQSPNHSFAFHAASIHGFPSGDISLTGGGTFQPGSGLNHPGGGFRCLRDVHQGPLAGCRAGEGIRWDSSELVPSTGFKCTGAATEALKMAFTNDRTVVMRADFYRAGDGTHESFTALMIVSADDLDPDQPGIQNVWVQGVGCGEAFVNFN